MRRRAADALELVFGPDPGLLRLRIAIRTVISASMTLTALLLLFAGGGRPADAAIALGFMTSIFSNMVVRDPGPWQQGLTLGLISLPALGSVALSSYLSHWQWTADIGFIVVVMAASLAPLAGPRGRAMGMVGFISYFVGEIIHPPLGDMPHLAIAVFVGIGAAALTRFVLLREKPQAALRQVRRHIDRRVDRILSHVDELLGSSGNREKMRSEARHHRSNYEIARLNDALLVAQDQIDAVEEAGPQLRRDVAARMFAIELAAERLVRMGVRHADAPGADAARRRIAALQAELRQEELPAADGQMAGEPDNLCMAVDDLRRALGRLPAAQDPTEAAGAQHAASHAASGGR
ncbi:MAG TPA: hypothetical protein VE224_04805 [Pseudolabrys sp.]|nr:hypothetical protein [Pseudolabrys sp.]